MCIYIYICTCVCICVYIYIYIHIHIYTHRHLYIHVYVYIIAPGSRRCPGPCRSGPRQRRLWTTSCDMWFRSAQVSACDDRALCWNIGISYTRAYALSSHALACVALSDTLDNTYDSMVCDRWSMIYDVCCTLWHMAFIWDYILYMTYGRSYYHIKRGTGLIVLHNHFFTCANPHVDPCSKPLPWDPP